MQRSSCISESPQDRDVSLISTAGSHGSGQGFFWWVEFWDAVGCVCVWAGFYLWTVSVVPCRQSSRPKPRLDAIYGSDEWVRCLVSNQSQRCCVRDSLLHDCVGNASTAFRLNAGHSLATSSLQAGWGDGWTGWGATGPGSCATIYQHPTPTPRPMDRTVVRGRGLVRPYVPCHVMSSADERDERERDVLPIVAHFTRCQR